MNFKVYINPVREAMTADDKTNMYSAAMLIDDLRNEDSKKRLAAWANH